MHISFRLLILALPIFLVGCAHFGSFNTKDKTYLYAQNEPPLQIPAGLSSSAFDTLYPVSHRSYPPASANISLLPPDLLVTNAQ